MGLFLVDLFLVDLFLVDLFLVDLDLYKRNDLREQYCAFQAA